MGTTWEREMQKSPWTRPCRTSVLRPIGAAEAKTEASLYTICHRLPQFRNPPCLIHDRSLPDMKSGLVLSDLHLFSPRSEGFERMAALWDEVTRAEVLVLNGDIFDFRWTCLPDEAATLTAALDWLHKLLDDFEGSAIHYVLGNRPLLLRSHPLPILRSLPPRSPFPQHRLRHPRHGIFADGV